MIFETKIETLGPLAISIRRATGFSLLTQAYIPGTTFRGAVAAAYVEGGGAVTDAAFQRVFVEHGARFTDQRVNGSRRWPQSARQCKEFGEIHERVDLLLAMGRGEELLRHCRDCGKREGKLIPIPGFGRRQGGEWRSDKVAMERRQHTAIDPRTLRAADGMFHSTTVVARDQAFQGQIGCEDEDADAVREILGNAEGLTIGRGGSRGQGATRFRYFEAPEEADLKGIGDRIRAANAAANVTGKMVIPMTFQSPALFLDEWLEPKLRITGTDLHPDLKGYGVLAAFTTEEIQNGWHSAAGLPKREERMLAAGSTFLLGAAITGTMEEEVERIAPVVELLERKGCGERLAEGFGEVECCGEMQVELMARAE